MTNGARSLVIMRLDMDVGPVRTDGVIGDRTRSLLNMLQSGRADTDDESEAELIRFRFGASVLVRHAVLVEQLFHFFRDHVSIVWHGHQRNFLARLCSRLGRRTLGFWGCIGVRHTDSIHQPKTECSLFKRLQRRVLRELRVTRRAGDEINGLANGHCGSKIQLYAAMLAGGT